MLDEPMDYEVLEPEQRVLLDELYEVRCEIAVHDCEVNQLKRLALHDPTYENRIKVEKYLAYYVKPLAEKEGRLAAELAMTAVDMDKLMTLLPTILAIVTHAVDIKLLLEAGGVEGSVGVPIWASIRSFIDKDIPPG